ncbi:DUF1540 domain-containing protein [Oscillospiraceae bacterium MB08-C2-2]|nr:DUF1540 domain-containing protein [Oscillospiraceae bacterium MB08-C2-2]
MQLQNNLPGNTLPGIKCHVTNCVYNVGQHDCSANEISVGPQFASCTDDTVCATFQAKS